MDAHDHDDADVKAMLRAQLGGSQRRARSKSVEGRAKSERAAMAKKGDARFSDRGETAQLNVNVDPKWKAWIAEAKQKHDMAIFEIVERGLELVRAELEKGRRNA